MGLRKRITTAIAATALALAAVTPVSPVLAQNDDDDETIVLVIVGAAAVVALLIAVASGGDSDSPASP